MDKLQFLVLIFDIGLFHKDFNLAFHKPKKDMCDVKNIEALVMLKG